MAEPDENPWRETVRDLYDKLHFGSDDLFIGDSLTAGIIAFIEERHPRFFGSPQETVHLTPAQQRALDRARRKSLRIIE